jgi:hypothetical protein
MFMIIVDLIESYRKEMWLILVHAGPVGHSAGGKLIVQLDYTQIARKCLYL